MSQCDGASDRRSRPDRPGRSHAVVTAGRDVLAEVRSAIADADWGRALAVLDGAGTAATEAEGLELRAQAAYGSGDFEGAVASLEQLHGRLVDEDPEEAARAAAMIAMYLMMDTGLMAPVRGWLRRAEVLLGDRDDVPAHAVVAMVRTYERFMCGDLDGARTWSSVAIELGERLDVQPAAVIGRVAAARVTIFEGRVADGLDQLDEVAALLMSGMVDPLTTGMMLCELVCAAQGLVLPDRAGEWTEIMEHWRHGTAFGGINGRCRVHRAEMLRISGPCDAAEEEALGACDDLRPWMRREYGWPLAELGNIRLRKGDLAGAEEAFLAAHEHAWSPQPGLALTRLEQGDVDTAAALISDAIAHPLRVPSKERPPFDDLSLAPLFEAQVEIAVAAGDLDTAGAAAERLDDIVRRYEGPWLGACAALARARVQLALGDTDAAVEGSKQAVVAWTGVGAPYEAASARMVLGEALGRSGHAEGATMEFEAARRAFAEFGAARRAKQAADRVELGVPTDPGGVAAPVPAPSSPSATFRLEGDTRTVEFDGRNAALRDLKGFRYLARLLAEPDREFHVLDLVAVEAGSLPTSGGHGVSADTTVGRGDTGMPVLDDAARSAYRRRLLEVEEDIEEATRDNDLGRIELAERDREYLLAELRRDVGLSGRYRATGSDTERARTSVTRSLRYAIARLGEHHPSLAAHLENSVRTGGYCSYSPEPRRRVDWDT